MRTTLQQCEADLDRAPFVRVHRSAIVNLDAVVDRRRLPGGDFRLRTRHCGELLLSRTRRRAFDAALARRR
ncbi:MAG TPA: LytTR family DNA-binding domain-containing protein [Planctomycetota bacterium]|nr:LytTR family DNA-binding domain-containing protein [Planctomycetota bacterium]